MPPKNTAPSFPSLKKELAARGHLAFSVPTGSMEPVIRRGDVIQVAPLPREPARFDILVFTDGTLLSCHYLWHRNLSPGEDGGDVYVTRALRGGEDLPVPGERVLGVVVSHRLGGATRAKLLARELWRRWVLGRRYGRRAP